MNQEETPFANRFCGRADVYSRYRPRYPAGIIRILEEEINFTREKDVADIGSGTGLLAEIFVRNGNRVYCIEPNPEMRSQEVQNLSRYSNFESLAASAEDTKLGSGSVELISVGQALHWFNLEKSRNEFQRILKIGGHVAVVYNERKETPGLMSGYEALIDKHARNRAQIPDIDDAYLSKFFQGNIYKRFALPNNQLLDSEGLAGRATSASYMPKPGETGYEQMIKDLSDLFSKYEKGGMVEFLYETSLILGKL
jgi:SAM-dependent methyltransferase